MEISQSDFLLEKHFVFNIGLSTDTLWATLPFAAVLQPFWKHILCFARLCLHSANMQGNSLLQEDLQNPWPESATAMPTKPKIAAGGSRRERKVVEAFKISSILLCQAQMLPGRWSCLPKPASKHEEKGGSIFWTPWKVEFLPILSLSCHMPKSVNNSPPMLCFLPTSDIWQTDTKVKRENFWGNCRDKRWH